MSQVRGPRNSVFGVSLEASLAVATKYRIPAIVYRCIRYLQINDAELVDGIYLRAGNSLLVHKLRKQFDRGKLKLKGLE